MECGEKLKSRSRAVPSAVVPAQIADYVARNFPGTFLVGIEHTCREWEVKLNNTIELTFDDKAFRVERVRRLIDILFRFPGNGEYIIGR